MKENSFPHVDPGSASSNYDEIRTTPDASQSPQASASTNSAIRAVSTVTDGVSQENDLASSSVQLSISFPVCSVVEPSQQVRAGNQTTYSGKPDFEAPPRLLIYDYPLTWTNNGYTVNSWTR